MFDAQLRRVDDFQQRHPWAGFPYAVVKKFGEDQGGMLAAVLSYYAFFSLFPLLVVFVNVLGIVLQRAPGLHERLVDTVTGEFHAVVSTDTIKNLQGHWWVIVVGVLVALWSGLAVANAAQNAFNAVYNVAYADRPDFIHRVGRSVVIVGTGFLLLGTTVVAGYVSAPLGQHAPGLVSKVVAFGVSLLLDVALFLFLFRWLTARRVTWKQVLPGAVAAAVSFAVLQLTAAALITHFTRTATGGSAAVAAVIGVLSWFYLQARVTLLCAEVNVVRDFRLWPRAVQPKPPGLTADRKAYELYAEQARFHKEEVVDVEFPEGQPTGGGAARAAASSSPEAGPAPAGSGSGSVHSHTAVHRGRVTALVVGTALAAWVHGRRTAHPSAGEAHEHQPGNGRR
ncbi:MAG: ribonuclease [Frankiales bacterium]|nr:ribonuclease [Frankiales bacterium]